MLEFYEKSEASDAEPTTTLTLPLDLRQKSRQRVQLDDGREAALFLQRGTVLKDRDLLIAEDRTIVQVKAAAEELSAASCDDPLLFARACYHLGNRHMALQITKERIYYTHDHVIDDMLRGIGLTVEKVSAPFEPEPGAYGGKAGGGHHHHAH